MPETQLELVPPMSDGERLEACTSAILNRLANAEAPSLLLDSDAGRFHALEAIRRFAEKVQIPVATLQASKGMFSEQSPLFAGLYAGAGSSSKVRKTIEESDCLLAVGYRRVDTNSGFLSDRLPADTIWLRAHSADVGEENYQGITLVDVFGRLTACAAERNAPRASVAERNAPRASVAERNAPRASAARGRATNGEPTAAAPREPEKLTQDAYWREMQSFLRPDDVIVVEDGTSTAGAAALTLPDGCTFIVQTLWGSIGYSVGALLGTLLAAPERRQLLFVGDGSFQLTAQELSTILRHDLKPLVFLINNGGYTIERAILGKNSSYNDVANWRYADLPRVFSRTTSAKSYVVRSVQELRAALAVPHDGLVFVESVMDALDAPLDIIRSGEAMANQDYGTRGPQTRPDARLSAPLDGR